MLVLRKQQSIQNNSIKNTFGGIQQRRNMDIWKIFDAIAFTFLHLREGNIVLDEKEYKLLLDSKHLADGIHAKFHLYREPSSLGIDNTVPADFEGLAKILVEDETLDSFTVERARESFEEMGELALRLNLVDKNGELIGGVSEVKGIYGKDPDIDLSAGMLPHDGWS